MFSSMTFAISRRAKSLRGRVLLKLKLLLLMLLSLLLHFAELHQLCVLARRQCASQSRRCPGSRPNQRAGRCARMSTRVGVCVTAPVGRVVAPADRGANRRHDAASVAQCTSSRSNSAERRTRASRSRTGSV